jgi:Mg2+ and Co2+ transporter CorA
MSTEELHSIINDAVRTVNEMDSATRLTAINSGLLDRSFQMITPTEEDVEALRQAVFTAKEAVANMSDILEATNQAYHSARQAIEQSTTVSTPTESYNEWSAEELDELIGIRPAQTKTIELTDELWNKQRNAATQRFYGIDVDTFCSRYIAGQIDDDSGCLMAVLMFFPELD